MQIQYLGLISVLVLTYLGKKLAVSKMTKDLRLGSRQGSVSLVDIPKKKSRYR